MRKRKVDVGAYAQLTGKETLQALLQRLQMERMQEKQAKAFSISDVPAAQRGSHIAQVVKAYPGVPLKEAIKRFAKNPIVPAAKPVRPKLEAAPLPAAAPKGFPTLKPAKFPAMKYALDLQFDSQDDAQKHLRNRELAGLAGTLGGGAIGGAMAGKRFGLPGAVVGGAAGALLGGGPGKLLADIAHDIPQRTGAMYDNTVHRMNAAGGEGVRLASAMDLPSVAPSVSDFIEFTEQYENEGDAPAPKMTSFEEDMLNRLKPMGLGAESPLEGGDNGAHNVQMGLPGYNGV